MFNNNIMERQYSVTFADRATFEPTIEDLVIDITDALLQCQYDIRNSVHHNDERIKMVDGCLAYIREYIRNEF